MTRGATPPQPRGLAAARASAARYRDWIVAKALPLWSTVGFDAGRGMFQERLDWSGAPQETAARRAMVQCRQIYVFSHAAHLGWLPEGGRLAEIAMDSLLGKFCDDRDPSGGFAFAVSAEGRVISSVRDAYAHAFALFAIAWLYRLNGDPRLIGYADRIIAFIDARLQRPGQRRPLRQRAGRGQEQAAEPAYASARGLLSPLRSPRPVGAISNAPKN